MPGWVWVAIGSALGGVARFGVSTLCVRWWGAAFPWGTLAVNVAGSALIGWLSSSLAPQQPPGARLFWMSGICGGFTTFSAFSLETMTLLRQGDHTRAAAYALASVALCGLAVLGGASLGRGR
jgi:fluoride exporter